MSIIVTKYSIGDVVYLASTSIEKKQRPCPDCNGTRKWKAISPAGNEYEFVCPRCSASYRSDHNLSLEYSSSEPSVRKLTIGSVRHDTHDSAYRDGIYSKAPKTEYMCAETGIGNGSLYDETKLFPSHEEALAVAKLMAQETNTTTGWIVKLYDQSLKISDYQLENAMMKAARDAERETKSKLWNLGYLFEEIGDAETKDEILEKVEYYKEYDWQRDKDKIAEAQSAKESA